jgi:hypothetical protein
MEKTTMTLQTAYDRRVQILALIDTELEKAVTRHDPMNSPHEGWAVIREELDELWEHVRGDTGRGEEAMKECIQIATMALRYIFDLGEPPLPRNADDLRDYVGLHARLSLASEPS